MCPILRDIEIKWNVIQIIRIIGEAFEEMMLELEISYGHLLQF